MDKFIEKVQSANFRSDLALAVGAWALTLAAGWPWWAGIAVYCSANAVTYLWTKAFS